MRPEPVRERTGTETNQAANLDNWQLFFFYPLIKRFLRAVQYQGQFLRGHGPFRCTSRSIKSMAWRAASKYSEGSPVRVHFNPDGVEQAVPEPGRWEWTTPAGGLVLVAVGVGLCYHAWSRLTEGLNK